MKKLLLAAAVLSMGFSVNASAGCSTKSCSGKITKLYVRESGNIAVATDGDEKALNCKAVSNVYVTLRNDSPNRDAIYSTLLAARASGAKVGVRISEGTSDCKISYVTY